MPLWGSKKVRERKRHRTADFYIGRNFRAIRRLYVESA